MVVPNTPNGVGDPDTVVCRAPQRAADSDRLGPKVCLRNYEWGQLTMNGKDLAPDGKTLTAKPTVADPKGDGDPDAVTCRTPVPLGHDFGRIERFGPEVCQTNRFWADLTKNNKMVDADGVVRVRPATLPGAGVPNPYHDASQAIYRRMPGSTGQPR